jgi:outer membrane murein-binding lipoprotein Lpp
VFNHIATDLQSIFNLRDEKSTLLSRVSSLQAQQAALENRLDSISQTADNAMEREREAEDRLDAALSIHARQLTQRQV